MKKHYDPVIMPSWRLLAWLAFLASPAVWGQCTVEQSQKCEQVCSGRLGHLLVACTLGCRAKCSKPVAPTTFNPVTISNGTAVTAADIASFDAQWLSPPAPQTAPIASDLYWAQCTFFDRFSAAVWGVESDMTAMARLYEITHDTKYLDILRQFIELALQYRDDNYNPTPPYPCSYTSPFAGPKPVDDFRGHVMPGWGATTPDVANFNFDSEVVASLYGYAIATFARIVAEDPTLQPTYGNDAIRYANAALETAWAFMPQVDIHQVGNVYEAHLSQLDIYRTKPSKSDCDTAYNAAKAAMDAANQQAAAAGNPPAYVQDDYNRLSQQRTNCENLECVAGAPLAHNESGAYAMMMIELWRVLDSDFYQHSNQQAANAGLTRSLFPLLVSRFHRYFTNRTHVVSDPRGDRLTWHYQDDQPSCVGLHAEDANHGAYDIRYLGELRASFDRINSAATSGGEPIPMTLTQLDQFANTFLEEIAPGANFNGDVNGTAATADSQGLWEDNADCDGWVYLAVADARAWGVCHDVSLRVINSSQPYLTIGNHSALLATKTFSASLLSATGKVTFLRVNDLGTGFGTPIEFLDAEVIVQLDSLPGKSLGFQLRADSSEPDHHGMLEVLRLAFRANASVSIDYLRNGADNGRIMRVARVN